MVRHFIDCIILVQNFNFVLYLTRKQFISDAPKKYKMEKVRQAKETLASSEC